MPNLVSLNTPATIYWTKHRQGYFLTYEILARSLITNNDIDMKLGLLSKLHRSSSHQDVFCKKGAFTNFAKFIGTHLY